MVDVVVVVVGEYIHNFCCCVGGSAGLFAYGHPELLLPHLVGMTIPDPGGSDIKVRRDMPWYRINIPDLGSSDIKVRDMIWRDMV